MSDSTLLPRNSTSAERALELSLRAPVEVGQGIDAIVTLKENPPENVLRWLIWEYGLDDLLPYISDLRFLISEGLEWERIKGTPESVRRALSWLNYGAPSIEEEDSISTHWAEFMIDPGGVPARYNDLRGIVRLSDLSAPVGTDLARIFHGYDIRRFKLDSSEWGDLLSDYSGVWDAELGVVLSFGRVMDSTLRLEDTNEILTASLIRAHATNHIYEDRVIWDFNDFGDVPVKNYRFMHAHLHQTRAPGVNIDQLPADKRVLPKAAIVPSDAWILGDTNSTLFAIEYREINPPAPISEGLSLSGEPWSIIKLPIDERIDRDIPFVLVSDSDHVANTGGNTLRNSFAENSETYAGQFVSTIYSERTSSAVCEGQFWTAIPWVAESWEDIQYIVRTKHYGDPA